LGGVRVRAGVLKKREEIIAVVGLWRREVTSTTAVHGGDDEVAVSVVVVGV
jgi:hypothetical protein